MVGWTATTEIARWNSQVRNLPASVNAAAKTAIDQSAKETERRLFRATPLGPGSDHIRGTIEVVDGDTATLEKVVRIGDSALEYAIPLDFGHVTAGGTHVAGTKFFRSVRTVMRKKHRARMRRAIRKALKAVFP